ncbi:MAG: NTP transferase domain-containing protein, partial [Pseudobdellovibrionaceae bacterium]
MKKPAATVCLLTAGQGTRMGSMGQILNKALFPIDGKAIISHIIGKFPADTEFVIGLGFLGEQVRNYLTIAHPNQKFVFVPVDNFKGPGSGPGYSLLCCSPQLQKPFYFVSCDTLWDNSLDWNPTQNWLGVAPVDPAVSANYCNLKIVGPKVTELRDKTTVTDSSFQAFVGLCYIKDFEVFWQALKNQETVAGEHQVSNGIRALIEKTDVRAQSIEWTDVGDAEKYKQTVSLYENFDFSKSNEALYIVNRQVIKFFADPKITSRRVQKSKLNPQVFPQITKHEGQFYAYDFQDGETLYKKNSPQIFRELLNWLQEQVWKPQDIDRSTMQTACLQFYKNKTIERLDLYQKKYPRTEGRTVVNGREVPSTPELLSHVPWERLTDGIPCFMHGDLQFDNIIFDEEKKSFKLLDWRQEFAGHVEFGDLYYDLAKLYGGIILNYDYI